MTDIGIRLFLIFLYLEILRNWEGLPYFSVFKTMLNSSNTQK